MGHEIDHTTGRAGFAERRRNGQQAWHGLGQVIENGDSLETIAEKAGLNWTVLQAADFFRDEDGVEHEVPGSRVNYRSDTKAPIGVVGRGYRLVQPKQVLEFFRDFLGENKLSIETAGSLKGGRIIWALAKLGPDFDFLLPGGDKIAGYFRLQTGFGGNVTGTWGRIATTGVCTTIRQVCFNTMNMIEHQDVKRMYRTPHSVEFDAPALQRALGFLGAEHRLTSEYYNELVKRPVSDQERRRYFCSLLGFEPEALERRGKDGKPEVSTRMRNMLSSLEEAFVSGPGATLKSAAGTAYGLLQAATYWVDHEAVVKKDGDSEQAGRLANAWYGRGADLKAKAARVAAELAGCAELLTVKKVAVAA